MRTACVFPTTGAVTANAIVRMVPMKLAARHLTVATTSSDVEMASAFPMHTCKFQL